MHILVTGGAGFIGSHTVDALLTKGHQVRILDNLAKPVHTKGKPDYIPSEAEFILGDVRHKSDLERALQGIDIVFHLAAYQDYLPDFSKFFQVNAVGTALIYEIIVEQSLPVQKVIVASSQAVMGEGRYLCAGCGDVYPNIRELYRLQRRIWEPLCPVCGGEINPGLSDEAVKNPQNQYAMSKYSQEMIAINLGRRYKIPSVGLRYSIVQGPRQSFYNAYSGAARIFCLYTFFKKAAKIYEDGHQIRDYINIADVVSANLMVMEDVRADYEVFNVGGGTPYTVLELLEIVSGVFDSNLAPEISGEFRFGDTRHIISDISKLKALGWEPKYTPQKSIKDYKDWLKEQVDIEDILNYVELELKRLKVVRSVDAASYMVDGGNFRGLTW
jgi:dTDP-L-rhamnose 4-epimerase